MSFVMHDEEWNLLEFGRSYSITKASLRVEVYTTLIKVIYIIFLANVGLLTHPQTLSRPGLNKLERGINNNEWPKCGRSPQQTTIGSKIDSDTILEFERPTIKANLIIEICTTLINIIYVISLTNVKLITESTNEEIFFSSYPPQLFRKYT
jgi:hypothetical protein